MPLLKKDTGRPYRPKTGRVSDLYKHAVGARKISGSVKKQIRKTLKDSGLYSKKQLGQITNDQELPLSQLKEVADRLNKKGVFGFERSGQSLVNGYSQQEITRRKSITRTIRANRAEQMAEPLTDFDKLPAGGNQGTGRVKPRINLKV